MILLGTGPNIRDQPWKKARLWFKLIREIVEIDKVIEFFYQIDMEYPFDLGITHNV